MIDRNQSITSLLTQYSLQHISDIMYACPLLYYLTIKFLPLLIFPPSLHVLYLYKTLLQIYKIKIGQSLKQTQIVSVGRALVNDLVMDWILHPEETNIHCKFVDISPSIVNMTGCYFNLFRKKNCPSRQKPVQGQ